MDEAKTVLLRGRSTGTAPLTMEIFQEKLFSY
jgi:hypothetical protein